ncbi:low molecular weight phosphotyrosine protein phosphatase [Brucella intermedia]|uniref:protein-tyrosine-phosphatase n=2 Tax=Brucella intermedia TaxID=94625 RepID=A0ABR6AR80_9HYPH|nr:low molecular weight protein-tyrosine-phosphatase [Brucella intermedia]KAB2695870.1 low molecular weight phosphotyrosine protein phosphatase [Brucella intermedia]KAB2713396.1 low molecular weight phosphotyrosine protein phosphatase [Brucella intermedia]MBA8851766.1 protein-tyrosine phosphatase [Brucella intermedia]MDH0123818.1 low molecular weight phosphotyrosine protein phosphatase [Brucella intermedia GD04153]MPR62605.1 low molecular weight phosphotyrosine protein phosphatase [Brucella in
MTVSAAAKAPASILFICAGNICRSPLAEGVMGHVLEKRGIRHVLVDSAGTNGYHTGEEPDERSISVAARHGLDISGQRCRQLIAGDFSRFDLILGMDRYNMRMIAGRQPANASAHIGLFTEIAEGRAVEIPDPYYGGTGDFEKVYRMVLAASIALADQFWPMKDVATRGQASSTM